MRARLLDYAIGALLGIGSGAIATSVFGWLPTLIAAAVLVLIAAAGLTVRAWRRGNYKVNQIFDEELDP